MSDSYSDGAWADEDRLAWQAAEEREEAITAARADGRKAGLLRAAEMAEEYLRERRKMAHDEGLQMLGHYTEALLPPLVRRLRQEAGE